MDRTDLTIHRAQETDKVYWNSYANHPLQTWAWGDFREAMGVTVERIVMIKKKQTDRWQLTFHHIPYTPWTIGYFPKGPMPTPDIISALTTLGKEQKSIYIQLEPNVSADTRDALRALGLKSSHHPLFTKYTYILDLTLSEAELLERMHPKTRYNIRVAQKHNVIVQENNSKQAFREYLRLEEETTSRQGFYAHSRHYHETMWRILSKEGLARLWTATYNGHILTAWVLFLWKDTVYYPYGASSRENRNVMAPTLLLWEISRWARKEGYKKFDLWGSLGPDPNPDDPWYGFHRFKQGFNPELVEFAGSFDLPVQPLLYSGFTYANALRWKILSALR